MAGAVKPRVDLFRRAQDHGHGLGVNARDFGVGLGREEAEEVVCGLAFLHFSNGSPGCPDTGNAASEGSSLNANQMRNSFGCRLLA